MTPMSTTDAVGQVEYPESDGKPMGETDTHRTWMMRILDLLSFRYREQNVYVASDLLVYYEPGQPTRFVVPDDFIVLDCKPGARRVFKTWEEGRVPDVVFEVTSRGTSTEDIVEKPKIYENMGVREYFLYDPTGEYLNPALQGYRLQDGVLTEIDKNDGRLACQSLGLELQLADGALEMIDVASGKPLLSEAESYRQEAERQRQDAERQRQDAERQRDARLVAEQRIRELEQELERLRKRDG
jgi:Uma2 family endonuclease